MFGLEEPKKRSKDKKISKGKKQAKGKVSEKGKELEKGEDLENGEDLEKGKELEKVQPCIAIGGKRYWLVTKLLTPALKTFIIHSISTGRLPLTRQSGYRLDWRRSEMLSLKFGARNDSLKGPCEYE